MDSPKELPELVTGLYTMSKDYLVQETIEPAKELGRYAGFGAGAGALFAVAALLLVFSFYALMKIVLPEGEWWVVLARGLTALASLAAAGVIGWRMSR